MSEDSMIVYHGTSIEQGLKIARRGELLSTFDLLLEQSETEGWKIPEGKTREEVVRDYIRSHYTGMLRKYECVFVGSWDMAGQYLDDPSGSLMLGFDGDKIEQVRRKPKTFMWSIPRRLSLDKMVELHILTKSARYIDEIMRAFEKYNQEVYFLE